MIIVARTFKRKTDYIYILFKLLLQDSKHTLYVHIRNALKRSEKNLDPLFKKVCFLLLIVILTFLFTVEHFYP